MIEEHERMCEEIEKLNKTLLSSEKKWGKIVKQVNEENENLHRENLELKKKYSSYKSIKSISTATEVSNE